MERPLVTISQGVLRGVVSENIDGEGFWKFHGIPYAKPPVGELRFKDPQPADGWEGIRDASEEPSPCYSVSQRTNELIGSEDCLYLNVYVKNLPGGNGDHQLKPVMFFIHGGAYIHGSSRTEFYGPKFLLTQDIVLVTINYRTGILGFLSFEDPSLKVSGNAGLKDQNLALQWVKKNIKNFGGDPNNVTIFGESAGSSSIHYHILSPKSKGLFHRAILQSGCALSVWAQGYRCYKDIVKALGHDIDDEKEALKLLEATSVQELHDAQTRMLQMQVTLASGKRPIGPIIEKESPAAFIWREPRDVIVSGDYNHVPIVFGYNSSEGSYFRNIYSEEFLKKLPFDNFVPWMMNVGNGTGRHEKIARKIQKYYSEKHGDDMYPVLSDTIFVLWILASVKNHVRTSSHPVYLYKMTVESGLNLYKVANNFSGPGVSHFDDIGYLFKNYTTPIIQKGTLEEKSLRRFVKLWTNFAKYGVPTTSVKELEIKWPCISNPEDLRTFIIGEDLKVVSNPENQTMEFWKKMFEDHDFVKKYL